MPPTNTDPPAAVPRWPLLARLRRLLAGPWRARPAPGPADAGPRAETTPQAPPPVALERCVSVVIPALNEARRIADVVRHAQADPATAEVIVIDDSSIDATAALAREAGARVVRSTLLGKGASMKDGLVEARHEIVVYLDGDLAGLRPGVVSDLARPIAAAEADFVKGAFGRSGGRVTELTAKPMLKVFFPELAHLRQPLGGLVGARASLLRQLEFEDGYGVDVALLIDAAQRGARIAEVDIGHLEHESQALGDLAVMANEVSRVIYARSRAAGRLHVEQIASMYEAQRQATAEVAYVASRRRGRTRLLLLELDGVVSTAPLLRALARATGHARALEALHEHHGGSDAAGRLRAEAALFRFVHRRQIEQVARDLELRPGIVEWVNRRRREGFMVGLVSEAWFSAAEVLRRRVFADFAVAHALQFASEVASGELRLNPAFLPPGSADDEQAQPDMAWVLHHLREAAIAEREGSAAAGEGFETCWAVGQGLRSLALLSAADRAIVMLPAPAPLRRVAGARLLRDLDETEAQGTTPAH